MFRGALHRCAALAFLFVMAVCAQAQRMEFSFTGLTGVTQKYLTDGTTLVQLPAGTDLTRMSTYGMSVTADDDDPSAKPRTDDDAWGTLW